MKAAVDEKERAVIASWKVGDVIRFGPYDWFVYSREDRSISLLCKDAVKKGTFHSANVPMTWEKCDLRKWLNGEFYDQFTPEEKKLIAKTHLGNPWNFPNLTKGGRPTDDYVFLLSIKEAKRIDQSMLRLDTVWWLRSPGYLQDRAATVLCDGLICYPGSPLLHGLLAVRPAMKLNIPA